MRIIYDVCNWISYFLIISLSVVTGTLIGGIILGIVPSIRAGISTIYEIQSAFGEISYQEIVLFYWRRYKKEFRSTLRINLLQLILLLIQIITGKLLNLPKFDSYFIEAISFTSFIIYFFVFITASIQPDVSIKSTIYYLIVNITKIVLTLFVFIIWLLGTMTVKIPIWFLSIGLLCYLFSLIRNSPTIV